MMQLLHSYEQPCVSGGDDSNLMRVSHAAASTCVCCDGFKGDGSMHCSLLCVWLIILSSVLRFHCKGVQAMDRKHGLVVISLFTSVFSTYTYIFFVRLGLEVKVNEKKHDHLYE